jgi:hypothetical protein
MMRDYRNSGRCVGAPCSLQRFGAQEPVGSSEQLGQVISISFEPGN